MIRLILGGLLLLLGLSTNLALAQDNTGGAVPVEDYWQKVEETLKIVHGLEGADAEAVQLALGTLASEFKTITAVVSADGRQIPLDNGYLIALFQDPEPDLSQLKAYLKAVQASRDRWPDPIHDAQDLVPLSEILTRPEFQSVQEEPGLIQRLRQRIIETLLDILVRIYPQSAGGLGPLVRLVLTIAGFIAIIAVLVFTLRSFLADIIADADSSTTGDGSLALISADQALEQAHAYSKTGDYRSAVRYLYISSLLLLEERGLLRYDRTQTNQEYLRSVAGRPGLAAVLRDVVDVFDRVWYGFQSLDEQAFSHYAGRVEELRKQQ
jgi:hypothetical protein